MEPLHFVDAVCDEHFRAMSLIHALGWRDTYVDAVPADWMARVSPTSAGSRFSARTMSKSAVMDYYFTEMTRRWPA